MSSLSNIDSHQGFRKEERISQKISDLMPILSLKCGEVWRVGGWARRVREGGEGGEGVLARGGEGGLRGGQEGGGRGGRRN